MYRANDEISRRVASHFREWGIPTAESLLTARQAIPELPLIASGGLGHGLDIAKAIALGATLTGLAGPFLQAATDSAQAVINLIQELTRTLRIMMFCVGARDITTLQTVPLTKIND